MDESLVIAYKSARRKDRLITFASTGCSKSETELRDDIERLLGCVGMVTADLPIAEQQQVNRVLGLELRNFLMDFCFDLSVHIHHDDLANALERDGVAAVIDNGYKKIKHLFVQAGVWSE